MHGTAMRWGLADPMGSRFWFRPACSADDLPPRRLDREFSAPRPPAGCMVQKSMLFGDRQHSPRPLVAAYFACVDAAEANTPYKMRRMLPERRSERCAVWALSQRCIDRLADEWDPTVAIVTAPAAFVPNLAAQAGRFTLVHFRDNEQAHKEDPPDLDQLFRGRELPDGEARRWAPALYKFTFPASEAGRLLHLISFLDVTAATIFPGLAGVERRMFEMTLVTLPAFRDDLDG